MPCWRLLSQRANRHLRQPPHAASQVQRQTPTVSALPTAPTGTQILSVSALNATARLLLEEAFRLVWIEGEISNLRIPASGHWYFTLKDARAQVRCVLFKGRQRFVRMVPRDGLMVRIQGAVSLYEERGEFQILTERMEPAGDGDQRRALELLKQKLAAEGLFAEARKRPLPRSPAHLVLITSATGAAVQDILKVLRERCPLLRVTLLPVPVQGDAAAPAISAALNYVGSLPSAHGTPIADVVILGRGGGSSEDLRAFDDERVARAVAACAAPVIAAIGHETDVSLADFVADARAPTPSAAAAAAVPDLQERAQSLEHLRSALLSGVERQTNQRAQALNALRARLRHPGRRLDDFAQMLDEREQRLHRGMHALLAARQQLNSSLAARLRAPTETLRRSVFEVATLEQRLHERYQARRQSDQRNLERLHGQLLPAIRERLLSAGQALALEARALSAVSPLATLERGYAVLRSTSTAANVISSVHEAAAGTQLQAMLRDGDLLCTVTEVRPDPRVGARASAGDVADVGAANDSSTP